MPNNSLFSMLDIDETAGIDSSEIQAIKKHLERVKIYAAGFAKDNDAEDTLQILLGFEQMLKALSGKSLVEINTFFTQIGNGTPAPTSGGRQSFALGGANQSGTEDRELRDQLDRANARLEITEASHRTLGAVMSGLSMPMPIGGPVPDDTPRVIQQKIQEAIQRASNGSSADSTKVSKQDLRDKVTKVEQAANKLESPMASTKVKGKDELMAALAKVGEALR